MPRYGAMEGGGTKWVCGAGSSPDDLETLTIPTTTPAETLRAAARFFEKKGIEALGVGSFGPLDLNPASSTYGHITSTPKIGWKNTDIVGELHHALGVPVYLDTDVNAAALGESRWGAAQGLTDFVYLTVGTGIGGGAMAGGRLVHGMLHPEMGHLPIPRDRGKDSFPGHCPYHGDCLEGLASGPAIQARWGRPGEDLPPDHPAWPLEAHYLATALASLIYTLSPQRIILGGGVMRQRQLFRMIEAELEKRLSGYLQAVLEIVPPGLGDCSGLAGALVLAQRR